MPSAQTRLASIGVWEESEFIGALVFSHGSNRNIGSPYGLTIYECSECVRIAMKCHKSPVTQVLAKSLALVKKQSPGIRLLVSYADTDQNHFGTIYQASNWVYVGMTSAGSQYFLNGKKWHKKALWATFGTNNSKALGAEIVDGSPKHKYLYPLDRAMRKQIEPLRKPYPKRETCGPSVEGDTPFQTESSVRSAGAALLSSNGDTVDNAA
jgi:hypothetical protein